MDGKALRFQREEDQAPASFAYQALRKLAMERGKKLGEIARQVVQAAELLS